MAAEGLGLCQPGPHKAYECEGAQASVFVGLFFLWEVMFTA